MKKIVSLVLTCASMTSIIAASSSSFAYVGNRPGALTATLGGGYFFLDSKRHMNNRAAGMVEVGYDFTEHWGIEALLAAFNTRFKKSVNDSHKISGTLFDIDGVYHFLPDNKFQPYVLAGVGILGLSPNLNDANNTGNINGGVGAQYFINKTFSLRLEVRDLYNIVEGRNDVFLNGGVSASVDFC